MKKTLIIVMTMLFILSLSGIVYAKTDWQISIYVESDYAPTDSDGNRVYAGNFLNHGADVGYPQISREPIIENGRTLVPLRQISETLGYQVIWNDLTRSISLKGKGLKGQDVNIEMKIGEVQADVNGKAVFLDATPQIVDNHTLVPLRFISEAMGCFVKYNAWQSQHQGKPYDNKVIFITSYPLIDSEDLPGDGDSNYYPYDSGEQHLKPNGQTSKGVRLGDSIEKVLQLYPRLKDYPYNYTGEIYYEDSIAFQRGSWVLVFKFENGILVDAYGAN